MFDVSGMNLEDGLHLDTTPWGLTTREDELVEAAAQMWRDGARLPMPERLERVGATDAERASILRKFQGL